ncbi:hypothetical protein QJS66_05140 [Kocuria rhizophila]|nr:hypothetical protein QJS66_05140 [Kocuria rhizophila]
MLTQGKEHGMIVKSRPDPGHGRDDDEASRPCSLHDAGCDIITLTQYLRPGPTFHPIDRWVKPRRS